MCIRDRNWNLKEMRKQMAVNWTSKQQEVIDSRNRNLLVSAAAGSGKTAVPVSYTHLDVYKRQPRFWISALSRT